MKIVPISTLNRISSAHVWLSGLHIKDTLPCFIHLQTFYYLYAIHVSFHYCFFLPSALLHFLLYSNLVKSPIRGNIFHVEVKAPHWCSDASCVYLIIGSMSQHVFSVSSGNKINKLYHCCTTHTHTHTHTHVGFYGLRGLSIGVMVFILYNLYVLLPYTYPTPKLSPHRRRCISIFPQKTHSVWFISILNYGDTENVLINHLLLVIPMSYPCHYTNLCPHKPHKHAHTHTKYNYIWNFCFWMIVYKPR